MLYLQVKTELAVKTRLIKNFYKIFNVKKYHKILIFIVCQQLKNLKFSDKNLSTGKNILCKLTFFINF